MSPFAAKLKIIFLPFVIVALGTIAGYTFLNWLLIIHLHLWLIDEDIINLFIPIGLPWIPLLIWVMPRLKLLRLKRSGRGSPMAVVLMFLWVTTSIPMMIAQQYLLTATGKLTQLEAMSQIAVKPATKYYKVKQFYPDKSWARVESVFKITGKHNNYFDMYLYVAIPVFDHMLPPGPVVKANPVVDHPLIIINGIPSTDSTLKSINAKNIASITVMKDKAAAMALYGEPAKNGAILITTKTSVNNQQLPDPPPAMEWPVAWVGFKYEKTISNNRSPADKNQEFQWFFKESIAKLETDDLTKIQYLDRIGYNKDQRGYLAAVNNSRYARLNHQAIILAPVFEPFEKRNGDKPILVLLSFFIGTGLFLIILFFVKPDWNYPGGEDKTEY